MAGHEGVSESHDFPVTTSPINGEDTEVDPIETAWLAGLYEGEGSLLRGSRGGWELSITMTDGDVIERAASVTGMGTLTYVAKRRPGWTDQWRWRVMKRDDIASIVTEIAPLLGVRRGQRAAEFLHWYDHRNDRTWEISAICRNGHERAEHGFPCRRCDRDRQRRQRARRAAGDAA